MFDIIFAAVFVLGAVVYLGFRLKKKIRSMRDPHASPGCSCGCGCSRKSALPPHLRKSDRGNGARKGGNEQRN